MILEELADALDATAVEWREDGWAPAQPPQEGAYIVVEDYQAMDRDDFRNIWTITHSYRVKLYDYGNDGTRTAVRDALMAYGLPLQSAHCTGYNYDTKLYETVYELGGLIEKARVEA